MIHATRQKILLPEDTISLSAPWWWRHPQSCNAARHPGQACTCLWTSCPGSPCYLMLLHQRHLATVIIRTLSPARGHWPLLVCLVTMSSTILSASAQLTWNQESINAIKWNYWHSKNFFFCILLQENGQIVLHLFIKWTNAKIFPLLSKHSHTLLSLHDWVRPLAPCCLTHHSFMLSRLSSSTLMMIDSVLPVVGVT